MAGALAFSSGCAARRSMPPVPLESRNYKTATLSEYNTAVEEIKKTEYMSGIHGSGPDSSMMLYMGCVSYDRDGKANEIIIVQDEMQNHKRTLLVVHFKKGDLNYERYALQCKKLKESSERQSKE